MVSTLPYVAAFGIACVSVLLLTPLVRSAAIAWDLVDRPDPQRKLHRGPIPLGGGLAVLLAMLLAGFVGLLVAGQFGFSAAPMHIDLPALAAAAVVICAVGLVDDYRPLRGRQKLLGQLVAVGILLHSGLLIGTVQVLHWRLELGLLAVPFTMFWLLGAINSLNLLDGADGFATTLGLVISGSIAVMAAMTGHMAEAILATALAGSLFGFMFFNFPPARVFLGDGGSMLIGLMVGVLAIYSALKGAATVALAAPLALLAIPILDTSLAVTRRWLTGRSLYSVDRGHLHHALSGHGLGARGLLLVLGGLCGVTAVGAMASVALHNEMVAVATSGTVVICLVVTRVFGFQELVLVVTRALAFGNSLVTATSRNNGLIRVESVHLQGCREWETVWWSLTEFAERHELSRVALNLNVAWLQEGYHGIWQRNEKRERCDTWLTRVPLTSGEQTVGLIEVSGPSCNGTAPHMLTLVAELVESLTPQVARLVADPPGAKRAVDQPLRVLPIQPDDRLQRRDAKEIGTR